MVKFLGLFLCFLTFLLPAQESLFVAAGESMQGGRCAEASDLMIRALRLFQSKPETSREQIGVVWQALGAAYRCQRLYAKAARALEQAVEMLNGPRKAEVLASLGSVYEDLGRHVEASTALQTADEMLRGSAADPDTLALLLNNRAMLERKLGHAANAEIHLHSALAVLQTAQHSNYDLMLYLRNNLAAILSFEHKYAEAAQLCRSTLAQSSLGNIPPLRAAAVEENCAKYVRQSGEKAEAARLAAHAKELRARAGPEPRDGWLVDVTQLVHGK